jgi:hypothetical protein
MKVVRRWKPLVAAGCVAAAACFSGLASSPAESPAVDAAKPSSYAPAADLAHEVDYFVGQLGDTLAKKEDFEGAGQSRVAKQGSTLAAICLTLAMHDSDTPLVKAAPAMVAAAQTLTNAESYETAKDALAALHKAADSKLNGLPTAPREWKPVAPLGLLMKQVPFINSTLKSNVQGEKFKTKAAVSAPAAAGLAAIAQATIADKSAVAKPTDADEWEKLCIEMRDAAGNVNQAIHAGDADKKDKALAALSKSCTDCHTVFRNQRK